MRHPRPPELSLASRLWTLRVLSFLTGLIGVGALYGLAWLPPDQPAWLVVIAGSWLAVAVLWLTLGRRARRPVDTLVVNVRGLVSAFIVPAAMFPWLIGAAVLAYISASAAEQAHEGRLGPLIVNASGVVMLAVVAVISEMRRSDGMHFQYNVCELRQDGLYAWHESRQIVGPWSAIGPFRAGGQAVGAYGRKVSVLINQPEQVSVTRGRLRRQVTNIVIPAGAIGSEFLAAAIREYAGHQAHREAIGTPAELDRLQAQFRAGAPSALPAK